jgi:hypothetical protein
MIYQTQETPEGQKSFTDLPGERRWRDQHLASSKTPLLENLT